MEQAFEGIRSALVQMKTYIESEIDNEIEKSKGIGDAFLLRQQMKEMMDVPVEERRAQRKAANIERHEKRLKAINEQL